MAKKRYMMKKSTTAVTNKLNPGNSASLVNDQRELKEEFSSKKKAEYVVRKSGFYSLIESPYEAVQKQTKVRLGGSYKPYENIIVVLK
jgi:hypothetical protein